MSLEAVGKILQEKGQGRSREQRWRAGDIVEDVMPLILQTIDRFTTFVERNDTLYATCTIPVRGGVPLVLSAQVPIAPIREAIIARVQNQPGWNLKKFWKSARKAAMKVARNKVFQKIVSKAALAAGPALGATLGIPPQVTEMGLRAIGGIAKDAVKLKPVAERIAEEKPHLAEVVAASSNPSSPNHAAAVMAVREVAARARTNPNAARTLAQMRIVNRVRQVASISERAKLGSIFSRVRRLAASRPNAPALLARLSTLEGTLRAQVVMPSVMVEIAPPSVPGLAVSARTIPAYPAKPPPPAMSDEPSEDAEAAGWMWNAPYRATGFGQRLRTLYSSGLETPARA